MDSTEDFLRVGSSMAIKETVTSEELQELSRGWITDSELLIREKRFGTSYYLCGYAIEMALKRRICLTLGWKEGYPNKKKKFENLGSFKTHNLDLLLHLSGMEEKIRTDCMASWSVVAGWDPEVRYSTQDTDEQTAVAMLTATKTLLETL
jgi:hypothetical protein